LRATARTCSTESGDPSRTIIPRRVRGTLRLHTAISRAGWGEPRTASDAPWGTVPLDVGDLVEVEEVEVP
jgi:hypothetical protein